jgi:subtilase family serine protease
MLLGPASPATAVRVELVLGPAHAGLLRQMAERSSGRAGLSESALDRLFRPAPAVRAAVRAYLAVHGFAPAGSGVLTQSFTGTAAQAESAFGVSLQNYRLADGTDYRAPSAAIHLPSALAARVITVSGLSTLPLEQPAGLHRSSGSRTPTVGPVTGCTGSNDAQTNNSGSLQPADLDGVNGYDSAPLLAAGDDGTGENVALVEFSSYVATDQSIYQTCYGTSVNVTRVPVNGGTGDTSGGDEVALDQEVLAGEAPGLDGIFTFVAPGSTTMATMLDAILKRHGAEGVQIVSDSWGTCEPVEQQSAAAATNVELQLMAVAGMSFYAASGDSGSADCNRFGVHSLEVDDPAAQPYATGVGGTNLDPSTSHHETVWGGPGGSSGGGGGGVSTVFAKPTWQVGTGVIRTGLSSKTKCAGKTHYCREVPDVALDADPATGYVIHCTAGQCTQLNAGWQVFGGTSAAAPLMAALTADANTYSLAHSGKRIGFADPFLYHEAGADPTMFNDVTSGTNNIHGGSAYEAGAGYDMASGLGSVNAMRMAIDLAAHTRSPVVIDATVITAGESPKKLSPGHTAVLSGTLKDRKTHTFLAGREVVVEGFATPARYKLFRVHTGRHGGWSLTLTTKLLKNKFHWHAVYVGEQGHAPAVSPYRTLGRIG